MKLKEEHANIVSTAMTNFVKEFYKKQNTDYPTLTYDRIWFIFYGAIPCKLEETLYEYLSTKDLKEFLNEWAQQNQLLFRRST